MTKKRSGVRATRARVEWTKAHRPLARLFRRRRAELIALGILASGGLR